MLVLLAQIQRTEKLQARAAEHKRPDGTLSAIDPDHVANLVEVLKAGNTFETNPIVYVGGDGYQLADGWHRMAAYEAVGRTEVEVEIREGGPSAAFRHALGANAHHGLPRSQASKRRAVDLALADADLGVLPDREIARITSTSHTFVAGRRALAAANSDLETAAPRSRAESLARARAQASGCLSYLLDLGIEAITHQALGSVRCGDLLPQLATMEWAGVKEIIRAAAQAEAEKRQAALLRSAQRRLSQPTEPTEPTEPTAPLPGQLLLMGGEVPTTPPVGATNSRPAGAELEAPGPRSESSEPEPSTEGRITRDEDSGAVTGPVDRERLRTALCRLQTGGLTRLPAPSRQSIMGALLILDEAPEEVLQRLRAAVQVQLADERARRELLARRLDALREQGEYTLTTARGTALCRPGLAQTWPLAGLDDLDRQIVTLEGLASETTEEPALAKAEPAEEDEMLGEALDAARAERDDYRGRWLAADSRARELGGRLGDPENCCRFRVDNVALRQQIEGLRAQLSADVPSALGLSEGASLDLVTREIARLRGERDRYTAELAQRLQVHPHACSACSTPTDRMEDGETTYPLCWACALQARDEVIAELRAVGGRFQTAHEAAQADRIDAIRCAEGALAGVAHHGPPITTALGAVEAMRAEINGVSADFAALVSCAPSKSAVFGRLLELLDVERSAKDPNRIPDGWPEGWIANPDVSGIVHAAWNAPRRPDGHRGPSAVIYTATDGAFEPTMELIYEDRAEDAAELLRRMAWGLAGRPLPAPVEALPDQQTWFVVHQRDGTPMVDPFIGEGAERAAKSTARSYAARWTDVYVMAGCPVSSADFQAEAMGERAQTAAVEPFREPRWLATVRDRLGAEPDEDVAFDAGRYVQAADVRRERERLGIPEYVAPAPAPDPMAIYKPWRGTAEDLAGQLTALEPDELERVRVAFGVPVCRDVVGRLLAKIQRVAP